MKILLPQTPPTGEREVRGKQKRLRHTEGERGEDSIVFYTEWSEGLGRGIRTENLKEEEEKNQQDFR